MFLFSDYIYTWLDNSLDYGITEFDFWNMTLAELGRALNSKKRMMKINEQKQATYDHILGDLIGRSVARIHSSSNRYPPIYDAYPTLFESEEILQKQQEKKAELSALRFKQFAESYNAKYKEASKEE
jgi:hypothetical protein